MRFEVRPQLAGAASKECGHARDIAVERRFIENEGGRGNFVSMPETIAAWEQANGCGGKRTLVAEALPGVADDARVTHTVWSGCRGVNMEMYVVEANRHGHPRAVLDKRNRRRVYDVIWDFFQQSGRQ